MKLSTIITASAVTTTSASVRHSRNLGKSGKGSHSSHHNYPGPPPDFWGPSYHHGSSSKGGKSSSEDNVKYVWVEGPSSQWGGHPEKPPPPPYWGGDSSSKSGKSSDKSGKGSGKSGKGSKGSSWGSSGKSGKGSSKSSKGSSKSGKGSVQFVWVGPGHPWGPPPPGHPWGPPPFHYGKSGKGSGKSGKGSHNYHPKPVDDDDDDKSNAWIGDNDDEWAGVDDGWNGDGGDGESEEVEDIDWGDVWGGGDAWAGDDVGWVKEDDDLGDVWGGGNAWAGDDVGWVEEDENYPNDVCFQKGEVVRCSGAPGGEAIHVEFSYSVETSGLDPEDTVPSLEGAILDAAVDYVSSLDSSYYGVTRVSSDPSDHINDEVMCTPKHSGNDCSIIKGGMTVYADSHSMDACDYANIVEASMDIVDYSSVDGIKGIEYVDSGSSCDGTSKIVSGEAAVTDDEGLSAGAMIGFAMLAAFIAAAALLLARKMRRTGDASDRDFDLISVDTDFEGNRFGSNDPFASTVDVHKCTSMYCNCNKGGAGTTFLPAPKKSIIDKVIKKQGIDSTSPTGVDEAAAQGFFVGDPEPLEAVSMDSDDSSQSRNSSQPKDSIIRAEPTSEERVLTPVREIAHDSEIDTEFESDGEEDLESIPPPPPLPPGHPKRNSLQDDEMSV
ncbi:hypothetical protein ACHAXN_002270 [Cyclotella atomus]